jgi:hypothetical protein
MPPGGAPRGRRRRVGKTRSAGAAPAAELEHAALRALRQARPAAGFVEVRRRLDRDAWFCVRSCSVHAAACTRRLLPRLLRRRAAAELQLTPGPVHGWRNRARLAVRGVRGAPVVGLFAASSHDGVAVPRCAVHHPRLNVAVELLTRAAVAADVEP